jgi:8-oxo-dGTP pyrophosphatase MutT (NUDIX family)
MKSDIKTSPPVAICALLRRQDGRYLLIRRAEGLPGGGHWCPVTGRPEPGEELPAAVVREVREEVGLDVEVGKEVFSCLTSDHQFRLRWFDCHPSKASSNKETLHLQADEVAEACWVTAKEASQLSPTFASTSAFFARLSENE